MSAQDRIIALIEEAEEKQKHWSSNIKPKLHTRKDLYKTGSPQEIADAISEKGKASYATTMSRLNFFINRAGRNLNPDIKKRVEQAKVIVRKKYDREPSS